MKKDTTYYPDEIWKDVPTYEGIYQASSFGRIRSLRVMKPSISKGTGYLAVGLSNGKGKAKTRHVHALVALAFLGPRPEGKQVNHIDEDKTNARPENLEYKTPRENVLHSLRPSSIGDRRLAIQEKDFPKVEGWYFEEGLSISEIARRLKVNRKTVRSLMERWRATTKRKSVNPHEIKFTYEDAEKIRALYATGDYTQTEIGRMFGCNPGHVSRIINNKLWPSGKEPRYKRRSKEMKRFNQ